MKKIILSIIIFLLSIQVWAKNHDYELIQHTNNRTADSEYGKYKNKSSVKFQNDIIGKWKLIKVTSGRTPNGVLTHTYSVIEIIFEFKPDNNLTIHCLRPDNNCSPWKGDYPYFFYTNGSGKTMIEIDNTSWWYNISETELMISKAPVDGGSYYFERYIIP